VANASASMLLWSSTVAISSVAIGYLAYLCAKRRAAALFLVGVALALGLVSWILGHYFSSTSPMPGRIPEWRHALASFYLLVPFAVVPTALTLPAVLGATSMRRIPILAIVGACAALPISVFVMWVPACIAVRDCP
jgi:hypothetical protein